MRFFRLAIGIFIVVQGIIISEWIFVAAGVLFAMMPILNIGCCGVSGCNTQVLEKDAKIAKIEDITYEEVH